MKIINLLPKNKQYELRFEAMLHGLWFIVILTLGTFAVVFLAQFGTKFYLQMQAVAYNNEINDLQGQIDKKENAEIKNKIKTVNDTISDFKSLATASPKWSKVIQAFVVLPPPGIRVTSFSVDPNKKTVTVLGSGDTRETIIQFYNNVLQDKEHFYNIDYPLENVVKPTNSTFHFTFYIQDKLLKQP